MIRGAAALALGALLAACGGPAGPGPSGPSPVLATNGAATPANVRFLSQPARPRLALLARDGDPAPALVAVVAVDLGSATTTALSAVVEARLLAAGFAVDTRVDRNAFRVRLLGGVASVTPKAFFAALAEAFRAPLGPGTQEIRKASDKLAALRRNPLPAPEAAPAADCANRLGLIPRERVLDPATPEGLAELEAARGRALTAARTALAVVGPTALCTEAERALGEVEGWSEGSPAEDTWPTADSTGTFAANDVGRGRARVTVALRVADSLAAVSAAERLGDPEGPLRARLSALPSPFRVTEVLGIARPKGGCVSVTAEADSGGREAPVSASALAAAIARKEMSAEVRAPVDAGIAARAVVAATDPRDAAARAAWWSLSGAATGAPERWATALAIPPDDKGDISAATRRFEADLTAAIRASDTAVVERRSALEQGQGEVWVLLASPCGTGDEGPLDAGSSALAALAVTDRAVPDVTTDPWITPDGVGILAHARSLPAESPDALARRVTSAAARAFAGAVPDRDTTSSARASALARIEKLAGPHGTALEGLLTALTPEHPTQLYPLGPFTRVAALATPSILGRWQTLANAPLRMAVLANASPAQATLAFNEADRWLAPRPAPRACPTTSDAALRPGRYEVELPATAELAQALLAGPVAARGQVGHDLAELAAHLLTGERNVLQSALDRTSLPVLATARLMGGARTAALVIDVRAPQAALDDAIAEVKSVLAHLAQDGPTDAAIEQALGKKKRADEDASFDPRTRLTKLWLGEPQVPSPAPTRASLQAFFASTFRDAALVLVEAKRR